MPTTLPPRFRIPFWIPLVVTWMAIGSASCQTLPPPARAEAREGIVRAGCPEEALAVASALDALLPAVLSELPDVRVRRLEVWVQKEPSLYRFPPSSMYRDADGFYSDRLARIHLRSGADDVRRTLVHELVHASLGNSWRAIPGTIEEGLCDVIATHLCPASAPRLRAGRLLAAALALGGFDLEYSEPPDLAGPPGLANSEESSEVRYVQHVFSAGRRSSPLDPMEVFRSHAGRSTESMPSDLKKALYGLAYLVTERIVERQGVEGFHALVSGWDCERDAGEAIDALLVAAGLTRNPEDWRRAISESIGPAELAEIARLLPGLVVHRETGLRVAEGRVSSSIDSCLDIRCGHR